MKIKIAILLLILASCGKDYRAGRKISKLQSWGYLKEKKDTVWQTITIPADTVEIPIGAQVDTLYIDSVLETINDTCIGKKAVKSLARAIPCKMEPINYDDSLVTITVIDGKLKVIHKKQKVKAPLTIDSTAVNNPEKHSHIWWWVAIVTMAVVILGLVFKK